MKPMADCHILRCRQGKEKQGVAAANAIDLDHWNRLLDGLDRLGVCKLMKSARAPFLWHWQLLQPLWWRNEFWRNRGSLGIIQSCRLTMLRLLAQVQSIREATAHAWIRSFSFVSTLVIKQCKNCVYLKKTLYNIFLLKNWSNGFYGAALVLFELNSEPKMWWVYLHKEGKQKHNKHVLTCIWFASRGWNWNWNWLKVVLLNASCIFGLLGPEIDLWSWLIGQRILVDRAHKYLIWTEPSELPIGVFLGC